MILCCNSVSKITPPVQSRCLLIRVSAPTIQEIKDNINMIAKKEKLTVPSEFAEYIATHSKRNMRRAILMLESAYVQQYPFTSDQRVALPDYEVAIAQIAKSALEDQSPARLSQIRTQLYELLSHCIPAQLILKELSMHWIKSVDDELKAEMVRYAALYDHRLQVGQKAIFHLEAYVAKFMSIYKRFLLDISG
ncbi:Subunit of heteropentameric Replication factor C (RF-C), partial [Spiromyces aspiralis]